MAILDNTGETEGRTRNCGLKVVPVEHRLFNQNCFLSCLAWKTLIAGMVLIVLAAAAASPERAQAHAYQNHDESPAPTHKVGTSNLGQEQGEPVPPNPLIYLDIWLFGGLILLVMIVVVIKFLWKALQPDKRDPSEGLQPWENPDYEQEGQDR